MRAKIQGLGQGVRAAFESIEYYIKAQDEKIEQLQKENAELKSKLENLNNHRTLKVDKFARLLNEMDIKSYEISTLQEALKIMTKYNDELSYREIILLLRYGSILFPTSCYDNDLKE